MDNNILEKIAEREHDQWIGWMCYMFDKTTTDAYGMVVIPRFWVERWKRQMVTKYSDLSEAEKESDRVEARKVLEIIGAYH